MKMIRRFVAQILVILLVIGTFISLLLLTFIGSTQLLFSKENVVELVNQVNFRELVGPNVEDDIYQLLEQTGLPEQYVDYIIKDEKFKTYIGLYMADEMEQLLYKTEHPSIDTQELSNILIETFDQAIILFEKDTTYEYLSEQDQRRIRQKLEEYFSSKIAEKIPEFENILESKLTTTKHLQTKIEILSYLYRLKPILSIFILIQLGLIFLLKIKKFHYIKWFMFPFLITGIMLYYLKNQLPPLIEHYWPKNLEFMKEFFEIKMQNIYISWEQSILICFVLSILFILLQILLKCVFKKRNESND